MSDGKEQRICKRCLLRELSEQEYREKLEKYIIGLDDEVRAKEQLYEKRLLLCKECEKLSAGTCLTCGCYVELRAAVAGSRCPLEKW